VEEDHPIYFVSQVTETQPTGGHHALYLHSIGPGFYAAIAKVITTIAGELDDMEGQIVLIAVTNDQGINAGFVGREEGLASL
jgi:hypothetical protein